jgi:hypothetical protein
VLDRHQALPLEGVEIGIHGVNMDLQEGGDLCGIKPSSVEENGLGAPSLPAPEFAFEQMMKATDLDDPRPADRHWARHGRNPFRASFGHSTKLYVTNTAKL